MKFLYKKLLKPILFKFSPEKVHNAFVASGEILGRFSFGRFVMRIFYGYKGDDISKTVDGVFYKQPILLSAGFDYNAKLTEILPSLSFGGVEVGSVTARKCLGNPSPTLTRLKKNQSIIVNKGLKNDGVEKIIERLKFKKRIKDFVIGISIAMTNDSTNSTLEESIQDYVFSLKRLAQENISDYFTINISCPNAYNGEDFANKENLEKLLLELKTVRHSKPMYIKMPINKSEKEFDEMIEVIIKHKMNGVVIGNLNKNYDDLEYRDEAPKNFSGGLSGRPTRKLSLEHIRRTKKKYGNKLTIIGVGGILTPKDAVDKFEAGADLVQLITGMIFEGPHLIKEICEEYKRMLKSQ